MKDTSMDEDSNGQPTLLDVFLETAQHPIDAANIVLKFGSEEWTYADLDLISNGIASDLHNQHGLNPTVATICENHPLVFAYMLATWKLGGIFAPIDAHSPPEMLRKMLENIEPICVAVFATDGTIELLKDMQLPIHLLGDETNLTSLLQGYLHAAGDLLFFQPVADEISLYIHTSSAAGPWNLKCVPISHRMLCHMSQLRARFLRSVWTGEFSKARVLGWAPWSHIMAIMGDVGAGTLLTKGCYIFALDPQKADKSQGVATQHLLSRLAVERPDLFVCVPFVLDGFRKWHNELLREGRSQEAAFLVQSLVSVKAVITGGATLSNETATWAQRNEISLTNELGMTETGPLFYSRLNLADQFKRLWHPAAPVMASRTYGLIDEEGLEAMDEGELVISSHLISYGYLKHDSTAFSKDSAGRSVFRTGDIYKRLESGELVWKGRKDDYIQMVSSETFDPRPIEAALNENPFILRSCIIGNNYLQKPSEYLVAVIEPTLYDASSKLEIIRTVAAVNKAIPPPLRISWSRVLLLEQGERIPCTRKGGIFRKKIESIIGVRIAKLEIHMDDSPTPPPPRTRSIATSSSTAIAADSITPSGITKSNNGAVSDNVITILSDIFRIDQDVLRENNHCTFAEFGMDSIMAVQIVKALNETFGIQLPPSTCHTHIDSEALCEAVHKALEPSPGHAYNDEMRPIPPSIPSNNPSQYQREEVVVIVGQAIRLPGDINKPDQFWQALDTMRQDIMCDVPADRWDHFSFYRPANSTFAPRGGDIYFSKAGFMDIAHFDHNFFGISAPEAKHMTPTTRLVLEVAFEALEHSGTPISSVKGSNMGVWVALGSSQGYSELLYNESGFEAYSRFYGLGLAPSAACGRLSYLLDVHGPSVTVDTACSSSMVAFHEAVDYLRLGGGESAIVASANTILWPGSFGFLSAQKMASPRSRCATFTNEADGYVPAEGAVAVILKTMDAALRDNDNILAVVKSTDVKHGGRSQGLVAPNVNVQVSLQQSLLQKADLEPSQVDFVEAHGTGTSLGDAIEIEGINRVFRDYHRDGPLVIGAAKTCVGHTEFAAGLVGIVKAIASFHHNSVPGLVHLRKDNINPDIDIGAVPMLLPTQTVDLPNKSNNFPRHGLVLSNGFAGTIAGTILASPDPRQVSSTSNGSNLAMRPFVFVLSAKSRRALEAYLESYLQHCQLAHPKDLAAICYTSCVAREHYRHRFATIVYNLEDLKRDIKNALSNFTEAGQLTSRGILFAFPGQGSQFQGMASSLCQVLPTFKNTLLSASNLASERSGLPISAFLTTHPAPSGISVEDPVTAQIAIFVYQYAVSTHLQALGISPTATLGHSLGEITAAVVSGALSFDVGLDFVIARARILRSPSSEPGGMAIVAASSSTIRELIIRLGLVDKLDIAVYNGPASHVVAGQISAVDRFVSRAASSGIRTSKLKVSQAFHSPSIHPSIPKLEQWLHSDEYISSKLRLPLYSTAYGARVSAGHHLKSSHWVQHAREPVRFSDAVNTLDSSEIDTILDIGPQPFVWTLLQSYPTVKSSFATSTKSTGDQSKAFLQAIAHLFERGCLVDFCNLFPPGLKKVTLPTYPYQRQHFYPSVVVSRPHSQHVKPTAKITLPPTSTSVVFASNAPMFDLLQQHKIESRKVVPGAALIDFFIQLSPSKSLKSISFHAPLQIVSINQRSRGTVGEDGLFTLEADSASSETSKIVSGVLHCTAPPTSARIEYNVQPPRSIMNHDAIYNSFNRVIFGPAFRNLKELRLYDTYADATICVDPSGNTTLDRMRKLDACLHMFGAITGKDKVLIEVRKVQGGFLPGRLDGITFNTDHFPDDFICRYKLPFVPNRDFTILHTTFEIISLDGDLLASCDKYSVVWVPTGLAIQTSADRHPPSSTSTVSRDDGDAHLDQFWSVETVELPRTLEPQSQLFERLHFITPEGDSASIYNAFASLAQRTTIVHLPTEGHVDATFSKDITDDFNSGNRAIILNLTSLDYLPSDDNFDFVLQHILGVFQLLGRCRATISQLVVVSSRSIPAPYDTYGSSVVASRGTGVGAVVQGMLRVFRREAGLDDVVWSLDLPAMSLLSSEKLCDIISSELRTRVQFGMGSKHRSVAYRVDSIVGLARLVPQLRRMVMPPFESRLSGVCVVVGMGDIGIAVGPALLKSGCSRVIYLGRRSKDDASVIDTLASLQQTMEGATFEYHQIDVCELSTLFAVIDIIQSSYGQIEHLIHTAVVLRDSSIQNVTYDSLKAVLQPKVLGAWNLHNVTQEKCSSLKSFVLLGSVSVSLGNEGQLAYVGGNFYMEALATYRVSSGLPAICLQLGPWSSSKAAKSVSREGGLVRGLSDDEGVSLILKAMGFSAERRDNRTVVQVIAKFDRDQLGVSRHYRDDPLFAHLVHTEVAPQIQSHVQPTKEKKSESSNAGTSDKILKILGEVLELRSDEILETSDSLVSAGFDSISFAQVRGRALQELGVEIPVKFLGDTFTIQDVCNFVGGN